MPIYEYQCKSCMREFEELTFGDEVPACPHCHSSNTEKVISRPCACRSGRSADGGDYDAAASYGSSGGGGGCSGCSGGSCASCGR